MERCSLVVIVRAGAVWSGVGTLAVALGGIAARCPGIIAISAVLLISRSPWGGSSLPAPLPHHRSVLALAVALGGIIARCPGITAISAVLLISRSPCGGIAAPYSLARSHSYVVSPLSS